MHLSNETHDVTITIDPTYTIDSADDPSYDHVFNPNGYGRNDFYSTFCIRDHSEKRDIKIALIGSCYSYDRACAILDGSILTVLQNDHITKIDLDTTKIISTTEVPTDFINISLHRMPHGLVIHGELEIIVLDNDCNVIRRAGSRDVITDIQILEDRILYKDDSGYDYEIGFDGNNACPGGKNET